MNPTGLSPKTFGVLLRLLPDLSLWKSPVFLRHAAEAMVLFSLSLIANYVAGNLATINAGVPLNDILLDNIPVVPEARFVHTTVASYYRIVLFFLLLLLPRYFPFVIKAKAILVLTRAVAVNLTSLGIPAGSVFVVSPYTFGGDLFFSGHVAITFLLMLIFWNKKIFRWIFAAMCALFATAVILGHLHYSIDVFAAPFIAYGIFKVAQRIFPYEYSLTKQ